MRIALFGGTFDPVHNAHLVVAREALQHFALDQVLFVPAGNPPHKHGSTATPYKDRLRMVELACMDEPRFAVSRLEEGTGKSYSIHTIEALRAGLLPGTETYFLIGADAFAEITSWYRWRDVVAAVRFIAVTRPGHSYAIPPGARVERLETVALPLSSSEIRAALERGERPAGLPPEVLDYIASHGLYRKRT